MRDLTATVLSQNALGKFEGEIALTEVLYSIGLDGGADASLGDVETFGFYELFADLHRDSLGGTIGRIRGAILCHTSVGFVTGRYYTSMKEARRVWKHLEMEWETANNVSGEES